MKNFKDYTRFPIIFGPHACLVIHVFKRTDKLEDIVWMSDFDPKLQDDIELYKRAANQFIDQLEGQYCDSFLEELITACKAKIGKK